MAVFEEECSSTARSQTSSSISKTSSSSNSKKKYHLAKSVLRSSVVLQLVRGHLRSPHSNDIVFAKETSIELVVIGEDGVVRSVCEQPVFGIIKDIAVLRWNDKLHARSRERWGIDLLVALSDSGKLSILSFCNEMHRFFPVTHVQLSNPGNATDQLGRMLTVDSSGCFIAASAFEERIGFFSVSVSAGSEAIDKKIFYPENDAESSPLKSFQKFSVCDTIWSMCFITQGPNHQSKENNPVLAVLTFRKGGFQSELFLLRWNIREQTVCILGKYIDADPLAVDVVEVPNLYGYAFLFRVGDACLLDLRDPSNPYCVSKTSLAYLPTAPEEHNFVEEPCKENDDDEGLFNVAACALLELRDYEPMSIDSDSSDKNAACKHVYSWTWEPDSHNIPRIIICLDTGEFYMIEISVDSAGLKVNLSDCLYKGIACKVLLWTEGGYMASFVEMGDGMVLKLEYGRLFYSSSIQSIAPILDMSVGDYHDEKHEQIYACCGVAPDGSLRVIRSGISVEKLLSTNPTYQGISGIWTVKMRLQDFHHSFLVLSFVEETRVLSVGLSFADVTDSVGFQPDVCTLACGLLSDGLLVQIHQNAVRLCLPTVVAHSEGITSTSPVCTSWMPRNMSISLGAVGNNMIIVSTSNPYFLYVLGFKLISPNSYEIFELQHLRLQNELSCISIPQKHTEKNHFCSSLTLFDNSCGVPLPSGVDIGNTFVVGTHRPSVEILYFAPDKGLKIAASGLTTLINTAGAAFSGCVPQDVRLVLVDRLYVLVGLRNGMLLRFEWPLTSKFFSSEPNLHLSGLAYAGGNLPNRSASSSSQFWGVNSSERMKDDCCINLQLIAVRRIGITPVFLVPLNDSLDTDIIALSDRPWLLHTARHSLSYTSISFQPSTHVTPVSTNECPTGILFVAENSLNLVEMFHSKRLNVQKFHLEGTPRKVLYHNESRLLLVMRTELKDNTSSSDICCVDPFSGSVVSSFKFEYGETGKSMALVRVGNEQVVVVGTSQSSGPAVMPSGEAESTKGRLIVLCLEHTQHSDNGSMNFCSKVGSSSHRCSPSREIVGYAVEQLSSSSLCSSPDDASFDGFKLEETEAWHFRLTYSTPWPGMVLAVCPYLDRYFLASASNAFYVCGFPNDNTQRVRRLAVARTRFMITTLTTHFTRIAVGDCRDGIIFFSYQEDNKKLEQLDSDPLQRLVADCTLMDVETAVVSDRKGSIAVLSSLDRSQDNASPEHNLTLDCAYHMGEVAMSIRKGKFTYKLPSDDATNDDGCSASFELSDSTIIVSTLLGSIIIFVPLLREDYDLLEALQARLVVHPLTAPILGNDHNEFRNGEIPVGVPKILDGDMLAQFLELTSIQQEAVLSLPLGSPNSIKSSLIQPITVNQVVQLLERVHYALN